MNAKEKYNLYCQTHQDIPVFAQPWWLNEAGNEWQVALLIENEETIAAFPFAQEKKMGLRLLRNPPLTPYMGPVLVAGTELSAAQWEQLWQQIPHYDSFEAQPFPWQNTANFFQKKGFVAKRRVTYLLDLNKDAAQLLAGMHSNHRNLIRQAIQAHQICTGLEFIDSLIHLHRNTYRKKNITYPFSKELLAGIIKAAIDKKQGEILVCKNEREQITAGIFIVWDTQFAYLLLSAGAGTGTHPGAVRLLIFEALQLAQKKGIQYFDFEGSMEPGIAAFFKRFGGVKKEYLEWKHYPSLLWRLKKKILG